MARRYSQIKRGAEYEKALDNYVEYMRNIETRPTKRLQGGVRGERRETIAAALKPFGADIGAANYLASRIGTKSLTAIGAAVTDRLFTQGANLAAATKMQGFRPARVSGFRGTGTASYTPSKVTKLFYLKYEGDSFSAPFGALTDGEEELAGGTTVKAKVIQAFGAADIKRVSISPEKVPV